MSIQFLLISLLHFSIISIFIFLAKRKELKFNNHVFVVLLLIILFDNFCIYGIPKLVNVGTQWNWIGKGSALILALLFIFTLNIVSLKNCCFTTQIKKGTVLPIAITFTLVAVILNGLQYLSDGFKGMDVETILYQATMPGITEEIIYRGILLGILNANTSKRWKVFGIEIGWGVIITSLLFGMAHGLVIDRNLQVHFDILALVFTGLLGFMFAWSKEKSGSIVPAIIGHNMINVLGSF